MVCCWGALGPVGINVGRTQPHMRFYPIMFMVSDAEDAEAHALLTNLYIEHAAAHGVEVTDAFLDQACLAGAAHVCGDTLFLHRR